MYVDPRLKLYAVDKFPAFSDEELLTHPQEFTENCCEASEAASPGQVPGVSDNPSDMSLESAGLPPQWTPRLSHVTPSSTIPNTQLPEILPQEDYLAPHPLPSTTAPHTAWRCCSSLSPINLENEPLDRRSFYTSAHIAHDGTAGGFYMPAVRCECIESIGNIEAARASGPTSFMDCRHNDSTDRTNEEGFT